MSEHVTTTCCECSEPICFSAQRHSRLRETGETFQCSRGHVQHFTDSELSRAKKRIAQLEGQLASMTRGRDFWMKEAGRRSEQTAAARRSRIAYQAASTRARNQLRELTA